MRILLTLALMLFLAAPALAAFSGPGATETGPAAAGGFQGPVSGGQAGTVAAAAKLNDDARVTLTGNLVQQLAGSDDKFIFRDATGEILVDIDRKVFQGRTVTPQNTIRISGEIDKDFGKPVEVDVKFLEIVK